MAKCKTKFQLHTFVNGKEVANGDVEIVGQNPKEAVYVAINVPGRPFHFISGTDKGLERFAVNILRALKSKKLKP